MKIIAIHIHLMVAEEKRGHHRNRDMDSTEKAMHLGFIANGRPKSPPAIYCTLTVVKKLKDQHLGARDHSYASIWKQRSTEVPRCSRERRQTRADKHMLVLSDKIYVYNDVALDAVIVYVTYV